MTAVSIRSCSGGRLILPDKRLAVLLVSMPFGNPSTPSLALSLLKAGLKNHGIDCRIEYHSLVFAKAIGPEFYLVLSSYPQLSFLGEWVFSQSAFGYRKEAHDESLGQLLAAKDRTSKWIGRPDVFPSDLKDRLIGAREKVEVFVNFCVDEIENVRPRVLGFTTMFSQNCSSLAVARRVKERLGKDAPAIIFGGSNCEGIMGYTMLKVFPWIDYVCCGEGDHAFIEFAANILSGTSLRVEGILGRKGKAFDEFSPARPVANMDELPFPDFDDYFESLRILGMGAILHPFLTIETSRGCWWAERSQCVFCGLNGLTVKYRNKTPGRLLNEIGHITERYGLRHIYVTDNILNPDFFKSLLPELARRGMKLDLQFETKSNLNRHQLRVLKSAGVRHIQPGIESFSDDILRLMRKGVTGLQNIWLLKCCREIGMEVSWNWLCGFPHEKSSEYGRMKELVPLLNHLQPPGRFGPVRLDRFSPLFNHSRELGVRNVRAPSPYGLIYPFDDGTLCNLAYSFDFDYEDGRNPKEYTDEVSEEVLNWMWEWNIFAAKQVLPVLGRSVVAKFAGSILSALGAPVPGMLGEPVLAMLDLQVIIIVWDTRPCAIRKLLALTGLDAKVFRYVDDVRKRETVIQHFASLGYGAGDVDKALANLETRKIVVADSGRCVSLATRVTRPIILTVIVAKGLYASRILMNLTKRRR